MPVYQDLDIYARDNANGEPIVYYSTQAIKNAVTLWIASKRGDYLMAPEAGGPLDVAQFKTMTPEVLQNLKFQLLNALTIEFGSTLEVQSIDFIPDYQNRILEISIIYTIPSEGIIDSISLFTNNNYETSNFQYITVEYVGDNLYEFFVIKKPDQRDNRLIYDYEMDMWKWGKYKFPNLTPLDSRFEDILIIANAS